jgi:hypothetical protein
MSNASKRSILRVIHLVLSIPILGYIYGKPAEVQQYAAAVRFVFVPIVILAGFWMYLGVIFALIGIALWISAYCLVGVGTAILSQVALFALRKIWLMTQAGRREKLP